jgi:FixJ family two-component response regulator
LFDPFSSSKIGANAESFLDTYQPDWPGCVLTHLRMPGITGLELQALLRERQLDVPVVVLTAHGEWPRRERR